MTPTTTRDPHAVHAPHPYRLAHGAGRASTLVEAIRPYAYATTKLSGNAGWRSDLAIYREGRNLLREIDPTFRIGSILPDYLSATERCQRAIQNLFR